MRDASTKKQGRDTSDSSLSRVLRELKVGVQRSMHRWETASADCQSVRTWKSSVRMRTWNESERRIEIILIDRQSDGGIEMGAISKKLVAVSRNRLGRPSTG